MLLIWLVIVTFQYRLRKDSLLELFLEYDQEIDGAVERNARAAIRDGAGLATAEQFFNNREGVQGQLFEAVQKVLDETLKVDAAFLQLSNAQLPDDYNNAVSNKVAAGADVFLAQNQRQQVLINSETQVLLAQQDALTTVIAAQANAAAILAQANADGQALTIQFNAQAQSFLGIKNALNFNSGQLVNFISTEQLALFKKVTVAVASPAPFAVPANVTN